MASFSRTFGLPTASIDVEPVSTAAVAAVTAFATKERRENVVKGLASQENLTNGPHTVEIVATGDGEVAVDGFCVYKPPLPDHPRMPFADFSIPISKRSGSAASACFP